MNTHTTKRIEAIDPRSMLTHGLFAWSANGMKQILLGLILGTTLTLAPAAKGGQEPIELGSANNFAVLAQTGISTVPGSLIKGDIGVSPIDHTALTGFSLIPSDTGTVYSTSAQVVGKIYAANYLDPTPTKMTTAIGDMGIAYTTTAGRETPDTTELGAGDISGLTILPGLHKWGTSVLINSDVTLDAQGDPNAIFIFQISGDLSIASSQKVILSGGAQAKNIFWQVGGVTGATIETYAHFEGIIMTAKAIVVKTGASFNGKLLAQSAVTLEQNAIVDANLIPIPLVTLEIISAHGMGTPSVGNYQNDIGSLLTNNITGVETLGGTQYVNVGWSMTGNKPFTGNTNIMTMAHTNNAVLTWLWTTNYLLDASVDLGGTITGSANGFYADGTNVTITATPNIGYKFVGWTGDVSGVLNDATQIMTMDQARTVKALFSYNQVTLEIISEHGMGLPPAGTYTHDYGITVTNIINGVETLGGTQYVNVGWSMTGNKPFTGTVNLISMTHTNNAVLTWLWNTNYLLDASANLGGTITGSANGFYAADTNVTITATPNVGFLFTGWTGDTGAFPNNDATQTMTMDQAQTVVAKFAPIQVALEIISDHGTGVPPAGIYTSDYGVTLTNMINDVETLGGTQFVNIGWSMTGNAPFAGNTDTMTMVHTSDAVLTWLWNTNYSLDASANSGGTVTGSASGFYADGASVTVTATPNVGFQFAGWTGDVSSPTNNTTQTMTMDQARTVVAKFAPIQVALEIISDHGTGVPPAGIYTSDYGVTLTNMINDVETLGGTQFVNIGWSMTGNAPFAGNTDTMTMVHTSDAVLTWLWNTNYSLDASTSSGGTISGSANGFYADGASVTVTATPNVGFQFAGWTGDVSSPTNNTTQTMTMDQARTVKALFSTNKLTLEIISDHGTGVPPAGIYTSDYGVTLTNMINDVETLGGTQFVNIGWSMTGNAPFAGNTDTMTMVHTSDAVLTWLWNTNYSLDASTSSGGTISGSANGFYANGTNVTLTATPNAGYLFNYWEINGVNQSDDVVLPLTMDKAQKVLAVFKHDFTNVTAQVDMKVTWLFNPRKGYFLGTLTITNTDSLKALVAPIWFEVEHTEWHWLRNPTGQDENTGMEYLDISAAIAAKLPEVGNGDLALDPGESVTITGIELMGRRVPERLVIAMWAYPFDTNPQRSFNPQSPNPGNPPGESVSIRPISGKGIGITWDSLLGRSYTVLSTRNLGQEFTVVTNGIIGTGETITYSEPEAQVLNAKSGVSIFYRVEIIK